MLAMARMTARAIFCLRRHDQAGKPSVPATHRGPALLRQWASSRAASMRRRNCCDREEACARCRAAAAGMFTANTNEVRAFEAHGPEPVGAASTMAAEDPGKAESAGPLRPRCWWPAIAASIRPSDLNPRASIEKRDQRGFMGGGWLTNSVAAPAGDRARTAGVPLCIDDFEPSASGAGESAISSPAAARDGDLHKRRRYPQADEAAAVPGLLADVRLPDDRRQPWRMLAASVPSAPPAGQEVIQAPV